MRKAGNFFQCWPEGQGEKLSDLLSPEWQVLLPEALAWPVGVATITSEASAFFA